MYQPGAADRLLQGALTSGSSPASASSSAACGTSVVARSTPSKRAVYSRTACGAAMADVVADGADLGHGGLDVGGGPGQDPGQGGPAEPARFAPAQVDTGNHPPGPRSVLLRWAVSLRRARLRPDQAVPGRTRLGRRLACPAGAALGQQDDGRGDSGQNASALLAPSASEAWKKVPTGLDASR